VINVGRPKVIPKRSKRDQRAIRKRAHVARASAAESDPPGFVWWSADVVPAKNDGGRVPAVTQPCIGGDPCSAAANRFHPPHNKVPAANPLRVSGALTWRRHRQKLARAPTSVTGFRGGRCAKAAAWVSGKIARQAGGPPRHLFVIGVAC